MKNPIVYTAFDGDYLTHINMMQEYVIMTGKIPLNPEHSLGYYISTTSHNYKKSEVLKDCLSLVRICDEIWIFVNGDNENIPWEQLPEGVIIELILWCYIGNHTIRVLCLEKILKSFQSGLSTYRGIERNVSIANISASFEKSHFDEMEEYIKKVMLYLRPVVLVDIKDVDFKYADWIRIKAYNTKMVPLIPQNIIPKWLYLRNSRSNDYENDLDTLLLATKLIWAIYRSREELILLKEKYSADNNYKAHFIPIQKFGIPKYSDPASWSITTQEYQENINILGLNK